MEEGSGRNWEGKGQVLLRVEHLLNISLRISFAFHLMQLLMVSNFCYRRGGAIFKVAVFFLTCLRVLRIFS